MLTGEAKAFEKLRRGVVPAVYREGRLGLGQDVADALGADLGQLRELLIESPDPHRLAALDASAGRLERAADQSEQGRFAGAVGAEDAGAFTRADAPGDFS